MAVLIICLQLPDLGGVLRTYTQSNVLSCNIVYQSYITEVLVRKRPPKFSAMALLIICLQLPELGGVHSKQYVLSCNVVYQSYITEVLMRKRPPKFSAMALLIICLLLIY